MTVADPAIPEGARASTPGRPAPREPAGSHRCLRSRQRAGLIEAVREFDVKLMPQALNARLQRPHTFAGDDRQRGGLRLDF